MICGFGKCDGSALSRLKVGQSAVQPGCGRIINKITRLMDSRWLVMLLPIEFISAINGSSAIGLIR